MIKNMGSSLILLLCTFTVLSCTRPQAQKSLLKIQFPLASKNMKGTKVLTADIASNVSTGFAGDFPINCYMVLISGPEPELQKNYCERKNDPTFSPRRVGIWAGGVASGGTLELDVPAGSDRSVVIAGFYSQSGFCRDFHKNGFSKGLSRPYLLGEVEQVNLPGGQTTEVPVALNFNPELWFDSCVGPDFHDPLNSIAAGASFISAHHAGTGLVTTTSGQYSGNIVIHGGSQLKGSNSLGGKYRLENVQIKR